MGLWKSRETGYLMIKGLIPICSPQLCSKDTFSESKGMEFMTYAS